MPIKFDALLSHGVTGNTSGFGPEESRFDPLVGQHLTGKGFALCAYLSAYL